jgi:hypothetical protein
MLDEQFALNRYGVTASGMVTAVDHPVGRFSVDTIQVLIPERPDAVEVERFRGDPKVGDQLRVRYERDDPTLMVEEGVSVWGARDVLLALTGVAGLVSAIIEIRRWPKRKVRGRPFNPLPRSALGNDDGRPRQSAWSGKPRRKPR